jgi:hypothetical protein
MRALRNYGERDLRITEVDAPPPPGVDYQRLDYRGDENVLPVPPGVQHRE